MSGWGTIRPGSRLCSQNAYLASYRIADPAKGRTRAGRRRRMSIEILQSAKERRELLQLVLEEASWKGKKLRMLPREPFENLRLSNSATIRVSWDFGAKSVDLDNWRRGGDSNPRYRFKPVRRFSNASPAVAPGID